jgi:hypothetical protein
MSNDPRKRLRYFNGQFLQAQDFIDEQDYHIDRQRRHNRLLHTYGVAEGLGVISTGSQITVTPGTAIDGEGRQILITANQSINSNSFVGRRVLVVLSYQTPESVDALATVGDRKHTRLLEQGLIHLVPVDPNGQPIPTDSNTFPPEKFIRLALLNIGTNGNVIGSPDLSVQPKAGAKIGDTIFGKVTISSQGTTEPTQFPTLTSGTARQLDVQGNLSINGDLVNSTSGTTNGSIAVRGKLDLRTTSRGLTGTPGAAFVWNSAGANSCGLVAKMTISPTSEPHPVNAAIAGVSGISNVHGVYAIAPSGTHALNVDGTARITGGVSATHFVDTFINASGQRLTMGDVVKLKGTPVTRFRGLHNKAPVAEVTLADVENDTCVIGIVDCEAIPDTDTPDTRVDPNDPTFIEDGGELYLVTLGAFAHCKVDATETAIAVGDLLTSSNNPGHAKKVTDPKLGTIIGKALEPLAKGTGYIAVFVNIQ